MISKLASCSDSECFGSVVVVCWLTGSGSTCSVSFGDSDACKSVVVGSAAVDFHCSDFDSSLVLDCLGNWSLMVRTSNLDDSATLDCMC